jgi:hypothetical protein
VRMGEADPERNPPGPPTDDELLERFMELAEELAVLPRDELRERMGAVLAALVVLRAWLEASHQGPRKPATLVWCFVSLTERFQILAARSETIGLVLHDDDLLPGEGSGSWVRIEALDLR